MAWLIVSASGLLAGAALTAVFYGLAWLRGWRIGKLSWPLAGDAGGCRRCLTAFSVTAAHPLAYDVTQQGTRKALLVLCERCWQELGAGEARFPFYADHLTDWIRLYETVDDKDAINQIKANAQAVAAALRAGM